MQIMLTNFWGSEKEGATYSGFLAITSPRITTKKKKKKKRIDTWAVSMWIMWIFLFLVRIHRLVEFDTQLYINSKM